MDDVSQSAGIETRNSSFKSIVKGEEHSGTNREHDRNWNFLDL